MKKLNPFKNIVTVELDISEDVALKGGGEVNIFR